MNVKDYYDTRTNTFTYLIYESSTKSDKAKAAIIDPVLDFDQASGRVFFESMNLLLADIDKLNLDICYILETHIHADHLTSSQYLKKEFPEARVVVSKEIAAVQKIFTPVFAMEGEVSLDGSEFDLLVGHGDELPLGSESIKCLKTAGHTPACLSYYTGKEVFTGDAMFMPDSGTGRCDFPEGSAADLFENITTNLYSLPDETLVYVGHDYQPGGRDVKCRSSISEQKSGNKMLPASVSRDEFIKARESRDCELSAPKLLLPSIQVNMVAGRLPKTDKDGRLYLKTPLKLDS